MGRFFRLLSSRRHVAFCPMTFVADIYVGCPHGCIYCYGPSSRKVTPLKARSDFMQPKVRLKKRDLVRIDRQIERVDPFQPFEYFSPKYHVMAHHHRHHGTSTSRDEPVTMKTLAEDFYQIILKKEISDFILIGHSMGTFVALEFMLQHQDLVKALVLIGGSSRLQLPAAVFELLPSFKTIIG